MKRTLCLLLFLSLALTGCAAAAPRFDLSAGEIAAAEGLTLHMPQVNCPTRGRTRTPALRTSSTRAWTLSPRRTLRTAN